MSSSKVIKRGSACSSGFHGFFAGQIVAGKSCSYCEVEGNKGI
jgi:hypothetical protein